MLTSFEMFPVPSKEAQNTAQNKKQIEVDEDPQSFNCSHLHYYDCEAGWV